MFPESFLRYLADAECSVVSWDAVSLRLVLKIEKEIGPERGVLMFHGASLVHVPAHFTVEQASSSQHSIPEFPGVSPEEGEWLFLFREAWGRTFYVVAQTASYDITG